MDTPVSILISQSFFRSLSLEVQEAFIAALRGDAKGSSEAAAMPSAAAESENTSTPSSSSGELPGPDEALDVQKDLSVAQFKNLVGGCGAKTKAALKAMVNGPTSTFRVAAVANAVGCAPTELSGIWGGITKRVRTVTADPEAYLWVWGEPELDRSGRCIDQDGTVTEVTYRSGRRVFGL